MEHVLISKVIADAERADQRYVEFLRHPALSMGVYRLAAGATDEQSSHTEDEVYYVISGHAFFRSGTKRQEVKGGSIIFVAANVEHSFDAITEDITVLVFFAPAEYSLSGRA